ncbi:putative NRPS-like protein biosynthetic cluster [Claviceps sorghi]|nr:putative NRPS-like protein biosynthetic cluster [Claviceps sorghi]
MSVSIAAQTETSKQHVSSEREDLPSSPFEPCILTGFRPAPSPPTVPGPPRFRSTRVDVQGCLSGLKAVVDGNDVSAAAVFTAAWAVVLGTYLARSHVSLNYAAVRRRELVTEMACARRAVDVIPCTFRIGAGDTLLDVVRQMSAVDVGESGSGGNTCVMYWSGEGWVADRPPDDVMEFLAEIEQLAKHDCVVSFTPDMQSLLLYRDGFMSGRQAEHLAATLVVVLKAMAEAPQQSVASMDMCSPLDREILSRWNAKAPAASDACVHDLIDQRRRARADCLAVVSWDGSLTYDELDRLSSRLAEGLRDAGVGPGVFVATCFDRGKWMPVGMLGIIKAGGAFCALEPSYPVARLTEMCQALRTPIILTTESSRQRANLLPGRVLVVGDDDLFVDGPRPDTARTASPPAVSSRDPVYAVFTSGSTGKPKGVVMEHGSFSCCALSSAGPLRIGSRDRILHHSSYAFDLSVFEILTPLVAGATIAIPSERHRRENLPRAMTELGATWAFLTPTVARMHRPTQTPSLETLCMGGEPISASDVRLWSAKKLITGYNPAECCPLGISGPANQDMPRAVGWSFSSQAAWIVDPRDHEKLLPVGAIGYLTGDLARRDADDGAVHFVGRKDVQVKINGQRVELAEIEHHLDRHLLSLESQGGCRARARVCAAHTPGCRGLARPGASQ